MDVSTNDNLHEKVNVSLLKHALHFTTSFVHYTGCAVTRGQRTGPQVKRSGCETWLSHLVVFLGMVLTVPLSPTSTVNGYGRTVRRR